MINEFLPDYDLGVVGAWQGDPYNGIPDLTRPTMLVLDCGDTTSLWETDPGDMPILAVHQIPSFKYTFVKGNRINGKYFKGYKYVSFGLFNSSDAYFMLVYVERINTQK